MVYSANPPTSALVQDRPLQKTWLPQLSNLQRFGFRVWNNRFLTGQGRNSATSRICRVSLRRSGRVVSSRCGSCLSQTFFTFRLSQHYKSMLPRNQLLEPEDEEARQERISKTARWPITHSDCFTRSCPRKVEQYSRKYAAESCCVRVQQTQDSFNWTSCRTYEVACCPSYYLQSVISSVLSRVQAFLPQIEASNAVLAQQVHLNPRSVDIEAIEDSDPHVIEMVRRVKP